jgi:hypothetical protein
LPATTFPFESAPAMSTPTPQPERTLRAAALVPPTVLFDESAMVTQAPPPAPTLVTPSARRPT